MIKSKAGSESGSSDHISETKGLQLFLQTDRYMGGYFNEFLPHSDVCLLSNWFSYIGIYYILYDYISVATDDAVTVRPRFKAASVKAIFGLRLFFFWSQLLVILTSVSAIFGKTSV